MAAYNITLSGGSSVTINDGAINNNYSVPIVGQNTPAFGDDIATAFLRGLENFAATTAPNINTNIPGTNLLIGQLWYDTGNVQLKVWTGSIWAPLLTSASGASFAGDVVPSVDSTYDIGTTGLRWAEGWFDDVAYGGTLTAEAGSVSTVSGTLTADGGSTVNLNGTNTIDGATFTDRADFPAASGGTASLRIAQGTSTSTTTGDMWLEADGVHVVIAGVEQVLGVVGPAGGVVTFNGRAGTVIPVATDYADGAYNFYPRRDSGSTAVINSGSTWTFSNSPTFDNATPFAVTNSALVANLNAEQLNGQLASYYAVDSQVVKLTGVQSVDGAKTFNDVFTRDASGDAGQGIVIEGTTNTTANVAYISMAQLNGTESVRIGPAGSDTTQYENFLSTNVDFSGNNNNVKVRLADQTTLYAGNGTDEAAQTQTLGGAGQTSQLLVWNSSASRNVGFNETPTITVATNTDLDYVHMGSFLSRTGTGSVIISVTDGESTIPVGGSCMVHNDNSTGTLTIAQGTGAPILEWIDGSGGTPLTGTRTLAYNGVATIRKKSSGATDVYQIWGVGLS